MREQADRPLLKKNTLLDWSINDLVHLSARNFSLEFILECSKKTVIKDQSKYNWAIKCFLYK